MKHFFKTIFIGIGLFFIGTNGINGQSSLLSDSAQISVLTCGTGNELYSLYGHTALRINDAVNQLDIVYNYGSFDFTTPNFYGKFIKGDLEYFVSTSSFDEFMYSYVYDNRSVFEQQLNLTKEQKQRIFTELGNVLSSEKRYYTYKFIDRNCTTMVRDVVNTVLTEPVSTKIPDCKKQYRQILYDYQTDKFYENLGINLMFGAKTDQQCNQLFLPTQLLEGISKTTSNGKPLTKATTTLYKATENRASKSIWNNFYSFTLVMLLVSFGIVKKHRLAISFLLLTGVLGCFFSLVGFYSFHKEVLWNYNVLVFNPIYLVLAYFAWKKNIVWTNRLVLISFGTITLYLLYMLNKAHLVMMLPIVATAILALWKVKKRVI